MSTTPAPPHPAAPRAAGPDAGYGYDVDRVDPRAPGRLGDMGPLRLRSRSRVVQWLFWIGTFLTLVVAALLVWFFAIRPLGFGTSLVAFTSALVPVAMVLAAVWWLDRCTPPPRIAPRSWCRSRTCWPRTGGWTATPHSRVSRWSMPSGGARSDRWA